MSSTSPQPLRIFVVEDHADTLSVLLTYLSRLGHVVFHATTMSAALKAIPYADCDVLISDVGLPDGNGWELLTRLQQSGQLHPEYRIVISGYGSSADRARSTTAGYHHHLLKPFNPRDLHAALDDAAQSLRRGQEAGH